MNRPGLIIFLFFSGISAWAQENKGTLTGKLLDSSTKQILSLATVTVFNASDTAIISYKLSDNKGAFRIPGIPHGVKSRVIISYSGYRSIRREFELNPNTPNLDLGTVLMINDPESLEEIVIIAERPPVIVRNDTIEFNAASFKTLPTALVEDLLRKLPGVRVDAAGDVTVNGQRVNRILVDGKAFFGNDPKMATRNLPAKFIDKIQVTDDKEEIDRSIDGNLTDIGKVINLSLMKGVKKGWFGKIYGGGGTDERYEAGGIGNIFRDTLQLSLLGFSNNVNRTGFSIKDVQSLGGFNRSGINSMSASAVGGNMGFALNNMSFGGMDPGISRTSGVGFNLNHAPNNKKTFYVQYFYGHTLGDLEELSNNQQFIQDTIINIRDASHTVNRNASHTASVGLKLNPDSLTNINLRAGFTAVENNKDISSLLRTDNNKLGLLSSGEGNKFNNASEKNYNHSIFLTRRSRKKKGRVFDLSHSFFYGKNLQHRITEQDNLFWIPVNDTLLFEQLRVADVPNINGSLNVNFTEPLTKALSIRVSQQLEYQRDEQVINTFDKNDGYYSDFNDQLSNGFFRDQKRSNSTVALTYRLGPFTVTTGANALWQDIQNSYSKAEGPVNMRLFDIMPSLSATWKKTSIRYSEGVTAPSIEYMNPVADNTNPFAIRESNPLLKPTRRRLLNANYFTFISRSLTNFSVGAGGQFIDDDIILARTIDEHGVQISKPINVDGTKRMYMDIRFARDFKNDTKFDVSVNSALQLGYNSQALMINNNAGRTEAFSFGPMFGLGLNWNDIIEFRPQYRIATTKTRYTDNVFKDLNIITHFINGEFILRWPKKIVWETNVNYRGNAEVAPGMPKSNLLWNAGLTYLMLKENRGQLKFSAYDLLNKNNSYYVTSNQNYIADYQSNVLRRYFMLTFTYDIRTMGAPTKAGGRNRLFSF